MSLNKKTSLGLSRAKPASFDGFGKLAHTAGNLGKATAPASSSTDRRLDAKFAAGFGTLGTDKYVYDYEEGRPAFQDVITGGIFDILQETKPVGYDSRAEAFNRIKGDAFGIADEFRSNKSMIEKTDAALQRISRIADGIRAMETTTLEQKLGDLSYGIFHGFYERVQRKWGKKLEKANDFLNRIGSIGR